MCSNVINFAMNDHCWSFRQYVKKKNNKMTSEIFPNSHNRDITHSINEIL